MEKERTLAAAGYTHRLATIEDIPSIIQLMQRAIVVNMKPFLSAAEIEAAKETMGVDRSLIIDGTYFLIESQTQDRRVLVGCGGWGKRRTLYGGDHSAGRNDSLSDPDTEAARIRAMYTDPDWVRRGVGSLLLQLGEQAAREAGFKTIELGSTKAGEPLYRARGYIESNRIVHVAANGADNLVITMRKVL